MRTTNLLISTLLIGIVLAMTTAWSQEDMTVVDNAAFDNPQRPPSVFVHDEHNEAAGIDECNSCHHVYADGELVEDESSEDQSCADCHSQEGDVEQPSLIRAFHDNCKGCHQQQQQGPILCGECHIK